MPEIVTATIVEPTVLERRTAPVAPSPAARNWVVSQAAVLTLGGLVVLLVFARFFLAAVYVLYARPQTWIEDVCMWEVHLVPFVVVSALGAATVAVLRRTITFSTVGAWLAGSAGGILTFLVVAVIWWNYLSTYGVIDVRGIRIEAVTSYLAGGAVAYCSPLVQLLWHQQEPMHDHHHE